MRKSGKLRLLTAMDLIIADLREATAAIQRDDFDGAVAKFKSARDQISAQEQELRAA